MPWLLDVITPGHQTSDLTPGVQCAACVWPAMSGPGAGASITQADQEWGKVNTGDADCFMEDLLLVTGYWF